MQPFSRRQFLGASAAAFAGLTLRGFPLRAQVPGERPAQAGGVTVLNPRGRVPLSFIIDDSTCLVNLAHFAIPQFAEVFPDRYLQDWKKLPREIPDSFVRTFAHWCRDHGVKGKYSVVPYPACVGWVDRDLPGWSKAELDASLKLVREELAEDWDFHPEMVSHTWVIDTKTGRPFEERSREYMENWDWSAGRSADELADYMAYALRILKNAGIPCDGVTTPGGFGTRALPELSRANLEACADVFGSVTPHYFRHYFTDERSVVPRVEYATGLGGPSPRCSVSIIGCTGDWFGGWDGLTPGHVDQFITADFKGGRLPEVINRQEPAILVCHWPGIYYNGDEVGFDIFKEVVARLEAGYDNLIWMKLSDIARYWAAKELTAISRQADAVLFDAPFECAGFTVQMASTSKAAPVLVVNGRKQPFSQVRSLLELKPGTWNLKPDGMAVCFDLPKGKSELRVRA